MEIEKKEKNKETKGETCANFFEVQMGVQSQRKWAPLGERLGLCCH